MSRRTRDLLIAGGVGLASCLLNAGVFLFTYNSLATPHLNEEQRVANAEVIMSGTFVAYALLGVLLGLVVFWALRRRERG